MQRRAFFSTAAIAAGSAPALLAASAPPAAGIVDTNVYLSSWTTRHSEPATPDQIAAKLRRHGVTSAWVGNFEGVLHTDLAGANARLAAACAATDRELLRPFGTVNVTFPDWEDDLRRCHEVHRMPGLRLFPSYHGYGLEDPRFQRLVDLAGQRRMLLQIVLSIEDERSHNPVLTAAPVAPAPLADIVEKFPRSRLMLLNGTSRLFGTAAPLVQLLQRLSQAGVWCEIATLEGVAGIESLLQRVPAVRLCFGSHLPYFYFEAALLRLQESALKPEELAAVIHRNAQAALPFA